MSKIVSIFDYDIKDKKKLIFNGEQIDPVRVQGRTRAVKGRESLTTRGKSFQ